MASGRGDFQRPLHMLLSLHLVEVCVIVGVLSEYALDIEGDRREIVPLVQELHDL